MIPKTRWIPVAALCVLTACAAPSGNYVVTAVDAGGKPLASGMQLTASGRAVYSVRNALCSNHPRVIVTIRSQATGQELEGESPYQCR